MTIKNEVFEIEKTATYLQKLGECLKIAIYKLPNSVVKQYLLLEIARPHELKNIADFHQLQNKISNVIDLVIQERLNEGSGGEETLSLLEEIREGLKKIDHYVEGKIEA